MAIHCSLSRGAVGKDLDCSLSVVSDHLFHEAFEAFDKRFWGICDRSGAERWMRVVLDDELCKFTGCTPEGLLRDEQCRFEASNSRASREEITIYDDPGAARDSFGSSQC